VPKRTTRATGAAIGGRARDINVVEDAGCQRVRVNLHPTFSAVVGSTCFSTTPFR
jgi:hypothetical protein